MPLFLRTYSSAPGFLTVRGSSANANNVAVASAPGAGLAIYVVSIGIDGVVGASTGNTAAFHAAGLSAFGVVGAMNPTATAAAAAAGNEVFANAIELPANTALQVDIAGGAATINVSATYYIAPAS